MLLANCFQVGRFVARFLQFGIYDSVIANAGDQHQQQTAVPAWPKLGDGFAIVREPVGELVGSRWDYEVHK